MITEPRIYQGPHDLDAMRRILIAGRQAAGPIFYVHVGDLNWWLFYGEPDTPYHVYLWQPDPSGEPVAWALFSPFRTFDVFTHPTAITAEQRLDMFTWAEETLSAMLRAAGAQRMSTVWISERDSAAITHLTAHGFQCSQDRITYMVRTLGDLRATPPLPPGFEIRAVAGEHEAETRAAAQYAAFDSSWDMARYVARYRRFMQSPVYDPELDLIAVDPEGRVAAFCICWLDEVNRAGHFEPVGTRAAFRRRGLGKAVVWEGLRRMKARGMETATVCPESDSPAAVGLYESMDFRPVHDLWTFFRLLT